MNDYIWISEDGKNRNEHRKIMEDYIGRKLLFDEIVHHKNDDRSDNRIENLQLMSRAEHTKLHSRLPEMITIKCHMCDNLITLRKKYYENRMKHGQETFMCSKSCVGKYNVRFSTFPSNKKRPDLDYKALVQQGLSEGLTGYGIAKKYGLIKRTVYLIISKLNDTPVV